MIKQSIYTLILTFLISSAFGQKNDNYLRLSEKITSETKPITGFDKIDVREDFEVFIRFSDQAEKVVIEANENLHDLIQVENEGGTLKIYTRSYNTGYSHNKGGAEEKLVVYITAKKLTEIKGDEDVTIELEDPLTTDQLAIYLNEDCILKGHLDVKNLSVTLEEDSELHIKGSAETMRLRADEDCLINSFDLIVEDLTIDLSDESEAKLTVNGDIDLKATEESTFYYRGDGGFTSKRVRGESEVKRW